MSKINKLGKSTFVIAILSFLLVAVLAFGGTYAYFSDKTETLTGSFTTGTLKINDTTFTQEAVFETNGVIAPGAPLTKGALAVEVDTNIKTAVIAVLNITVPTGCEITAEDIVLQDGSALTISGWEVGKTSTDGSTKAYVYKSDSDYFVSTKTTTTLVEERLYLSNTIDNGTDEDEFANQGKNISISITFYAIQYDYLAGNGVVGNYTDAPAVYEAAAAKLGINIA